MLPQAANHKGNEPALECPTICEKIEGFSESLTFLGILQRDHGNPSQPWETAVHPLSDCHLAGQEESHKEANTLLG